MARYSCFVATRLASLRTGSLLGQFNCGDAAALGVIDSLLMGVWFARDFPILGFEFVQSLRVQEAV